MISKSNRAAFCYVMIISAICVLAGCPDEEPETPSNNASVADMAADLPAVTDDGTRQDEGTRPDSAEEVDAAPDMTVLADLDAAMDLQEDQADACAVTCALVDLSAASATRYDAATKTMTISLAPDSLTAIGVSFGAMIGRISSGGGMMGSGQSVSGPGVLNGDRIEIDLSELQSAPGEEFMLRDLRFELECGAEGFLDVSASFPLSEDAAAEAFTCL